MLTPEFILSFLNWVFFALKSNGGLRFLCIFLINCPVVLSLIIPTLLTPDSNLDGSGIMYYAPRRLVKFIVYVKLPE